MTTQLVQLDLYIPSFDPSLFDVIEVWRSTQGAYGPYDPVTSAGARGARIPGFVMGDPPSPPVMGPLVNISGLGLQLLVGGTVEVDVAITGADPLHYNDIATQITAQGQQKVHSLVIGSNLVVETNEVGTGAQLEVTGGDVAALTGLTLNVPSFGTEGYVPLVQGQQHYLFIDKNGAPKAFYKTRLRNTHNNTVSDFSVAFQPTKVPAASTVVGFVDLVDLGGKALAFREVRVQMKVMGDPVQGSLVAGSPTAQLTDINGHVEFTLVRGIPIQVAIAGTNIVRDIVVPSDPAVSSFSFLDPAYGSDDLFQVDVPNISWANRTSF